MVQVCHFLLLKLKKIMILAFLQSWILWNFTIQKVLVTKSAYSQNCDILKLEVLNLSNIKGPKKRYFTT